MGTKNNPGQFDCYEAADPDEPMFVLLARDPDAADLVRQWALKREARDGHTDKVCEAFCCAVDMERWAKEHKES